MVWLNETADGVCRVYQWSDVTVWFQVLLWMMGRIT